MKKLLIFLTICLACPTIFLYMKLENISKEMTQLNSYWQIKNGKFCISNSKDDSNSICQDIYNSINAEFLQSEFKSVDERLSGLENRLGLRWEWQEGKPAIPEEPGKFHYVKDDKTKPKIVEYHFKSKGF